MLLVFILGLVFGSFANVLIYRLPKNLSLWGRSFCPGCRQQISWFDNIPLISFFLLQGRCRYCRAKISWQYPLVEFSVATLFVASFFILHSTFYFFLIPILVAIFVIDLQKQIIPDELIFAGLLVSVLYFLLVPSAQLLVPSLFSGFTAATLLLLLHLVTRGRGMGLGDVKFAVLGGTVAGLDRLWVWLLVAFLTGAVVGVILILGGKAKLRTKIAFGPFLILALFLVILCANLDLPLLNF